MADAALVSNRGNSSDKKRNESNLKRKKKMASSTIDNDVNECRPQPTLTSVSSRERHDNTKTFQFCAPCLREDRHVGSTNFCDNCQENLCPTCVGQHSKFPTMKDHVIHGQNGETIAVVPLKLANFERHNGKVLDMYCYDHDAVRCAACIATHHRKCKQVSYLPEAAKDISESQEYKDVIVNLVNVKSALKTSKVKRQEDNTRLVKERDDAITRIKYVREKINKYLDKMEMLTLDKLDVEYIKYNKTVDKDVATCDDIIGKLESLMRQLTEEKQLDDANRFILMRRANQTARMGENTVDTLAISKGTQQIQFLPDTQINDAMNRFPTLGVFASEQRLMTGSLIGQFDVHLAADLSDCQLLGANFLPDGKALISDWENKKVKLLSSTYKVIDHLKCSGCPYSVCCINQNEGAVSITNKKILQFFTIDYRNKLVEGRVLKISEISRDVAYNNGKIYVVCVNQISIYSLDGRFIRNIINDSSGEALFTRPLYIALNSTGNICVGDEDKGVISLNENGDVLGVFLEDRILKYPYGVTIVNNDQLFACGFGSHNLVQIGRNLMLLGEVLSENAGLRNPRSVCYDVNSHRILVTCKNTNYVRVYSLK